MQHTRRGAPAAAQCSTSPGRQQRPPAGDVYRHHRRRVGARLQHLLDDEQRGHWWKEEKGPACDGEQGGQQRARRQEPHCSATAAQAARGRGCQVRSPAACLEDSVKGWAGRALEGEPKHGIQHHVELGGQRGGLHEGLQGRACATWESTAWSVLASRAQITHSRGTSNRGTHTCCCDRQQRMQARSLVSSILPSAHRQLFSGHKWDAQRPALCDQTVIQRLGGGLGVADGHLVAADRRAGQGMGSAQLDSLALQDGAWPWLRACLAFLKQTAGQRCNHNLVSSAAKLQLQ